ncbi:MAG TPA: hypothetical protein VEP89_00030 [Draconibacterium sp.]|nr:hypothetical protein [Draconibacterium sp.]
MFKRRRIYSAFLLLVFIATACSPKIQDEVVASVGDKVLYRSKLNEILPKNTSSDDSIALINDYINKWVKQELLIQKANENLSPEQKDLSEEILDYRNSLIIYKYKNELIKQRMDTVVTNNQIETYYNSNQENFNLSKSIVKATFVMIPADLANPELVKQLVSDTTPEGLEDLREYCGRYAKKANISADEWINFDVLKNNFPEEVENDEAFLKQQDLYEMNDSDYYYIVSIHDYKLNNDIAPLSFVENDIKNLILNQRKISFLKEIEENIYTEGIKQKKFKIYDAKTNEQ